MTRADSENTQVEEFFLESVGEIKEGGENKKP
jgi:hypothetical protein